MYSVALSGLSFVNALVPGVLPFGQAQAEYTPVCGLSRLRRFSLDNGNKLYTLGVSSLRLRLRLAEELTLC